MKTIHDTIRPVPNRRGEPASALERRDRLAAARGPMLGPLIEPPLGSPLEERVGQDRDPHDRDHAHRHGVAQARVVQHVAADLRADQEGHERDLCRRSAGRRSPGRRRSCRTAGPCCRGSTGEGSAAPRTASTGGVAPMFSEASRHSLLQPVDGRRDDQDHERQLEVEIDDLEPDLREDPEAAIVDQVDVEDRRIRRSRARAGRG